MSKREKKKSEKSQLVPAGCAMRLEVFHIVRGLFAARRTCWNMQAAPGASDFHFIMQQ